MTPKGEPKIQEKNRLLPQVSVEALNQRLAKLKQQQPLLKSMAPSWLPPAHWVKQDAMMAVVFRFRFTQAETLGLVGESSCSKPH